MIDFSVAHSARVWDYWLGGRDNYAVDRAAGDAVAAVYPDIVRVARETRRFMARAVGYLAGEVGIRQFLDIGTGLPTMRNTHEVAQEIAPDARIVYVDNDPLVLTHARAWLGNTTSEGATTYLHADIRHPGALVDRARGVLDLDRPVAVMFLEILGHIPALGEVRSIVSRVMGALPPGSYLVLGDSTDTGADVRRGAGRYAASGSTPYHLRSPEQLAECFAGLELVPPGLVPFPQWRPGPDASRNVALDAYGAVARKP